MKHGWAIGCPKINQFLNFFVQRFHWCKIVSRAHKKIQRYRPINDIMRTIFVYGFMIMGKELLAELKLAIVKIWLDTRLKMEMHDPNVYPTILGGVSRGFWSPFLD